MTYIERLLVMICDPNKIFDNSLFESAYGDEGNSLPILPYVNRIYLSVKAQREKDFYEYFFRHRIGEE